MTRLRSLLVAILVGSGLAIAAQAAPGNSLRVQIVDERGMPVRDAVVELASSRSPAGPIRFPWRMAMAQKDQQFVPGTLVIARGSTVAFPNLDRVRHSVYSFSKPARFTIDLYGRDQTRTQNFPIAGTVALGCNIHDAMRGYIRVTDTPFAGKTDANGYVALGNIPAGTANLTVWHPRLRAPGNETSKGVTIAAGAQSRRLGVRLR
ncbi:plastocyanin/azurin family domain protein [Erythrobacter sp. QSSC1-22B]|uniref:plastocyanin/azurin family domain protein n=1 Tax=Erythrobacter sp. QSSC1-22B TaxID=1860125 RepID=UPI000805983B|nr:plastocyanin/azurin family domain protein [Erythrobacter sp. QSSC1-22B]OBX19219.1 plastocyanin/azurin family domain protein [Erythrobacter sp. QSSC1-22B]